jgi:hypothetical protein
VILLLFCRSIGRGVDAEQALLNAISGVKGRGSQDLTLQRKEEFDAAVAQLEEEAGVTVSVYKIEFIMCTLIFPIGFCEHLNRPAMQLYAYLNLGIGCLLNRVKLWHHDTAIY